MVKGQKPVPPTPTLSQVVASGNAVSPNGQRKNIVWKDSAGTVRGEVFFTEDPAVTVALYGPDGGQQGYIQLAESSIALSLNGAAPLTIYSDGRIVIDGTTILYGLPDADPNVGGALWNDAGTVKVSAG